MSQPPPLSVVVTTTQPWPEARLALDSLVQQVANLRGEIILVDGFGDGVPAGPAYTGVRVLNIKGAHIFRLRAEGLRTAKGEIVAITEDHCRASSDWCRQVLKTHTLHPQALIIGGAVYNGATRQIIDWANFFYSNEPSWPPSQGPWRADITGQANASYKHRALVDYPRDNMAEGIFRDRFRADAGLMLNEPACRIHHVQSLGFAGSCRVHFHDGRCIAALRRARAGKKRLILETMKNLLVPLRALVAATRVTARCARRHPEIRPIVLRAIPWTLAVSISHVTGEFIGWFFGYGDSPWNIP